jgi:putative SOS response-associated peptidase YedK
MLLPRRSATACRVILDPVVCDLRLDVGMTKVDVLSDLLRPYHGRLMRCYPVSTRVNRVENDDAECSAAVEQAQIQSALFS